MEGKSDHRKQMTEIETVMLQKLVTKMVEQRKSLGMSQRELAGLCNMPQSSIGRIETFKTTPNLRTVLRMMHYLGMMFSIDSKQSEIIDAEVQLLHEIEKGEKSGAEDGWISHEEMKQRFGL